MKRWCYLLAGLVATACTQTREDSQAREDIEALAQRLERVESKSSESVSQKTYEDAIEALQSEVAALKANLESLQTEKDALAVECAATAEELSRVASVQEESLPAIEAATDVFAALTLDNHGGGHMELILDAVDFVVKGGNLRILNGEGSMDTTNGKGNLIIGDASGVRGQGSHNIIIGDDHTASSYGGIVVGRANQITAPHASVLGGWQNVASAENAVVLSGEENHANARSSSVLGGSSTWTNEDDRWQIAPAISDPDWVE